MVAPDNQPEQKLIKVLSITFNHPIYSRQLARWRGAFIEMAGLDNNLFHNHKSGEEYHYRYPLIHYRIWKGKAGITAFNEGVDAIQQALSANTWEVNWEGKPQPLSIEDMRMHEHYLRMLATPKQYQLFKWLALNQQNYERWRQCKNLAARAALLESILTGQILGFCDAMDWRLPERLEVNLQHLNFMQKVKCHGSPMLAFNATYDANVLLPTGMALGKGVSHGFGWQVTERVKNKKIYLAGKEEPASSLASK